MCLLVETNAASTTTRRFGIDPALPADAPIRCAPRKFRGRPVCPALFFLLTWLVIRAAQRRRLLRRLAVRIVPAARPARKWACDQEQLIASIY